MIVIPINLVTLPLIALLNNGVEPQMEEKPTFFLYYYDSPARIITDVEWQDMRYLTHMTFLDQDVNFLVKAV